MVRALLPSTVSALIQFECGAFTTVRSRALTWPGLTLQYCMRFVGDRAL